jgi:putative secretion ATPase (PEP-CTERM system associated)
MYETFYGLTGKPFQLNPDPSFFFGSRQHRRAMAYLEYGLHQNEGFIVITGEIGAGKTTLVRNLLDKLDPKKVVAAQLVSTMLDAEDMLRMVSAAFGLPVVNLDKAAILLTLEAFLVSLTEKGKRALMIVDEAQNLTPRAVEELRMLSNFQLEDHALLQSFLIGQPEFRQTMQSPHMQQLRQRVIASCHIGPMDAEDTRAYVEHRLKLVGWKGASPQFESGAYDFIYEFSNGIPRRINTLCDRLLLSGFLADKRVFNAEDVRAVGGEIHDETFQRIPTSAAPSGEQIDLTPRLNGKECRSDGNDFAKLDLDAETAEKVSRLITGIQAGQLEDRLTRIERSVGATLGLLQQLIHIARSKLNSDEVRK